MYKRQGNDSMNGEVEFVGDGFVGHALHNAGDDFFFALAQGFLFAVFFLFLLGVQQVVDFGGDDIYVIAHGEVLVIFLQYVVVDDGAYPVSYTHLCTSS